MRRAWWLAAVMLAGACPHPNGGDATLAEPSFLEQLDMSYPDSPMGDVVDDYHGTQVADPYRWLEHPDAGDTRAWIAAQNELTGAYLGTVVERRAIRDRLTALWDHERYGLPHRKGGRYFWLKNDGLQDQAALYTAGALDAEPEVLIDPNGLSEDGTIALMEWEPSEDGRLVAYSLSDGGSDWRTWRVRDVETGADLADEIVWSKFSSVAWAHDGSGFWYCAYDAPADPLEQVNQDQKLYFHRLGDDQADDALVYHNPDEPNWGFGPWVSQDGATLFVWVWQDSGERNRIYVQDLSSADSGVVPLFDAHDATYAPIGKKGRQLWVRTTKDAPKGRIVRVDMDDPAAGWVEVVPEGDDVIEVASIIGDHLLVSTLRDAHAVVHRYDLDGASLGEVALPGLGTAWGFGGEMADPETFFAYTSYTRPTTIYRFDAAQGTSEVFREPSVDFDPDAYETTQRFVDAADGTRVPVFVTHKKGLELAGDNPTLLYGYGGFNISLTPEFSVERLVWMEMGGVFAVANLRGGGEYGEEWHLAGTRDRKQNVFDDFVAVAEHLVAQGYTRPDRLAIQGRSNGGLLVGATVQQRPDLFGAALPGVGVMDMLRFHEFTIGRAWTTDYGSSDEPDMFEVLLAYSPVHNAAPAQYPSIMAVTADHDDRVVPAHSYKFTAAMQAAQLGTDPVLIRIETRAGHGAGMPTSMKIEEIVDQYAFLVKELHMAIDLPD